MHFTGANMRRQFPIALLAAFIYLMPTAPARGAEKIQNIQAVIRTEEWKGWGGGEPLPDSVGSQYQREKFTRVAAEAGKPQVFAGKVLDLDPGHKADVGIVSLIGTHWLTSSNYEWFPLDKSMTFSVTSAQHADAPKALGLRAEGRPWTFLRAQFDPGEGATGIELRVKPSVKCVITMEDASGN